MSHFTKIKTKLYDRATIEKSLTDLNIDWESGTETVRGYKGQKHSAEIVIRQNNSHDIGFKWNGKEYELVTDHMFWDQKFSVNKFINQVNQRYAYNLITKGLNGWGWFLFLAVLSNTSIKFDDNEGK